MAISGVSLALVGDMFIQRQDPDSIFAHAASRLNEADIAFGNLEGPITDVGEVPDTKKTMRTQFRSGEETIHAYTRAGIDALSLANNHMMNMGPQGMLRCIEVLDAAGIAHAGAGRTIDAAHEPAVVERKGVRVAFLAYTCVFAPPFAAAADRPGMAKVTVGTSFEPQPRHLEVPGSPPIIRTHPDPNDTAAMVEDVRRAREQADVVVTSWHWGLSGATGGASAGKVLEYQVGLAHTAIDAGADLVVGHHPHRLEGIEAYRGKAIFYSLGNFAFDFYGGVAQQTIIARCDVGEGKALRFSYVPVHINEEAQPVPCSTADGRDVAQSMEQMSEEFGTRFLAGEVDVEVEIGAAVPA